MADLKTASPGSCELTFGKTLSSKGQICTIDKTIVSCQVLNIVASLTILLLSMTYLFSVYLWLWRRNNNLAGRLYRYRWDYRRNRCRCGWQRLTERSVPRGAIPDRCISGHLIAICRIPSPVVTGWWISGIRLSPVHQRVHQQKHRAFERGTAAAQHASC